MELTPRGPESAAAFESHLAEFMKKFEMMSEDVGEVEVADEAQADQEEQGSTVTVDQLLRANEEDAKEYPKDRTKEVNMKMTNLGIAAAAEIVNDTLRIDSLPDDTTAPDKFDDWRASVQRLLEEIEKAQAKLQENQPIEAEARESRLAPVAVPSHLPEAEVLDFGPDADNFRVDVLVAERKKNETEEAKSAVTYRYRQATLTQEAQASIDTSAGTLGVSNTQDTLAAAPQALSPDAEADATADMVSSPESSKSKPLNTLKASLVNKIMRVISDSLVTTAKPSMTGAEHKIRWTNLGIKVPEDVKDKKKEQDQVPPSTVRTEAEDPEQAPSGGGSMTSRSHVYDALQDSLKMPLSNAGLTTLRKRPLQAGSWIVFGFADCLWVGQVKVFYLKGAGIRPTHNYEETCNDIATLSRVVVLGYRFYGTYMTPLTATLPESGNHVPTYFFIHSDHLILSLDAICPNPFMNDSRLHIGHGFFMEKPSAGFQKCWDKLLKHQQELLGAVSCLVRRSSSRAKHTLEPDSDEEEAPSRKRARM
ncbi:hypothetical protein BC834DRAFT_844610 [Gloeopeniophorella convolvens]|nr:hypothetical protein BC834DRAFT_844610 [Gloeopeniophorella convolvens]